MTAPLLSILLTISAAPSTAARSYQRVVALAPSNAEIVVNLGQTERLVAVSHYVKYPDELDPLPRIGGLIDPDLESIVALDADLLLMRGANAHLKALCNEREIDIYLDRTDSLASIYTTVTELGRLLDCNERAQSLNDHIGSELETIRDRVRGRDRPRVLLTIRSPDRLASITTVSGASYLNSLIEIAGGNNIFGEMDVAYPQVRLEEIVARAPQVIIEAMPDYELDDNRRSQIVGQWARLTSIPAVRSQRVHLVTEDYTLIPSPRITQMAGRLSQLIHPEQP